MASVGVRPVADHDAGITEAQRKAWSTENGLPASTGEWSKADFEKAFAILEEPTHRAIEEAADALGIDNVQAYAEEKLGRIPVGLKDWKAVLSHMNADADADQRSLV